MFTIVAGPPCSGKTTRVLAAARPGDIIIDFDLLAEALGSPDDHDHPATIAGVAAAARLAAIDASLSAHQRSGAVVWLTATEMNAYERRRLVDAGATVVDLAVDAAVLHERADAGRPARWHDLIDRMVT